MRLNELKDKPGSRKMRVRVGRGRALVRRQRAARDRRERSRVVRCERIPVLRRTSTRVFRC